MKAYFERLAPGRFRPTEHTSGAWNTSEQHIAPALGLLAHLVEADRDARRTDGLRIGRLSFDLLGTIPMEIVETEVRVVRPGRTIELVEATLSCNGRAGIVLRAWLMQTTDTNAIATRPGVPLPGELPPWDQTAVWAGGLLASVEMRRESRAPGRATAWIRTDVALIDDGHPSHLARAVGLFDLANAIALPVRPDEAAFPNVELTAHVFREPGAGWIGFDTNATLGTDGRGVNTSTVHDHDGPFGVVTQSLTVRPVAEAATTLPA